MAACLVVGAGDGNQLSQRVFCVGSVQPVRRVENGTGTDLTQTGAWAPVNTADPNDLHIPLVNSPY